MTAAPVSTQPVPRESRQRLELEITVFSGIGFALGFGWLWFAAMQTIWLPDFLWGHLLWGGGTTLFAALTVIGFFLVGVISRRFARKAASGMLGLDFRTGKAVSLLHGLSFSLVGCGVLLSDVPTISDYLPVACIALAAIPLGVYWASALFALPPRQAIAAFTVSCVVSAGLAVIAEIVPRSATSWILCSAVGVAWIAAVALGKVLRQLRLVSEIINQEAVRQKRPRGRPQQTRQDISPDQRMGLHWSVFLVVPMIFFLAGFADSGIMFGTMTLFAGKAMKPVLMLGLNALGACVVLLACREKTPTNGEAGFPPAILHFGPASAVCGAFIIQGLVLLTVPAYFPYAFPIVEGAACAAFFALLSISFPGRYLPPLSMQRITVSRASLVLGSAIFCSHFGYLMSGYVLNANDADLDMGKLAAIITGGVSLVVSAAMLALLVWDRRTQVRAGASPEAVLSRLTQRERDIASLVLQDKNNKDISADLFISEDTVRFHLKNIYQKTGLPDREALRTLGRN